MGDNVELDRIYVVDPIERQRNSIAHTLEFQLRHMFDMTVDVHPAETLREVGKELGTQQNEFLILGPSTNYDESIAKALSGFCVGTMVDSGSTFEGQLGQSEGQLTSRVLHLYRGRRPQVLVVDDSHPSEEQDALQNWGVNARVTNAQTGDRILRAGKHRAFDMILVGDGLNESLLHGIADGAPPIYFVADVLPCLMDRADHAGQELRERLLESYGSHEQIKGVICPRNEYGLITEIARSHLPPQAGSDTEEDLDIDLTRGSEVEPTAILRRDMLSDEGPAKLIYAGDKAMQSQFG